MMGKKERGVWKVTFAPQVGNLQKPNIFSGAPKTSLLTPKVSGLLGFPGLRRQRADGRHFKHQKLSIRKSR